MNIKIKNIITKSPDKKRCICGKCPDRMVIVQFLKTNISFNDQIEWIPSFDELEDIQRQVMNAYFFNIKNQNYCYKAKKDGNNAPTKQYKE